MATCQSQRLSSTQARKIYGMQNFSSEKRELDSYIKNAEEIRKSFAEKLANHKSAQTSHDDIIEHFGRIQGKH